MLLLGRSGLPIFAISFSWSLGTGALYIARPLFAAELGASIFFVVLVNTAGAIARPVLGPIAGIMMDRWGRRPVLLGGTLLNGIAALSQTFATSYTEFIILEFIAGVGRAFYIPANSVLLADFADEQNRGRATTLRGTSSRLGAIGGPFIAGLVAAAFGLRAVFAYQALTKFVVFAIILFFIAETAPQLAGVVRERVRRSWFARPDLGLFATRTFAVLALASFCVSMMSDGLFGAIFPVYAKDAANLSTVEIANVIALGAIVTTIVSIPSGTLMDIYGRKRNLVPGLFLLGLAAYLLAHITDMGTVLLMMAVNGIGQGISLGVTQVYAMDLAPAERRGTFLGTWTAFTQLGGLVAPLFVGFMADRLGFQAAYFTLAASLVLSGILLWLFAEETLPKRRAATTQQGVGSS